MASSSTAGNGRRNIPIHQRTRVSINVYDLLPPGKLSTFLWTVGCGLLHTGVVVNDREYAFGGHDKRGVTGVYWMKPRTEPPGGTFRCQVLHGWAYGTEEEINRIILNASDEFLGPTYNLLTRNCNHFTSSLCEKLTGKAAPKYINRAAGIGVTIPCIVPAEWVEPPECEEPIENDYFDEEARLVARKASSGRRYSTTTDEEADESSGDEWGDKNTHGTKPNVAGVHRKGNTTKYIGGRSLPVD
ncbi:DUF862-domain-containing protein [Terfezia boudieri ATCC MYA-4762]|uniref:DUF862-domain-containing protein n=1 Tax=Terfezia boudieri ATCC MYA-4762 TaxID=1051890 RepID=A0A3N4LMB9_9PEZI|nr:DUF862-domain-containing protein [Terfezia boudieri ATCC MYA-4762]